MGLFKSINRLRAYATGYGKIISPGQYILPAQTPLSGFGLAGIRYVFAPLFCRTRLYNIIVISTQAFLYF